MKEKSKVLIIISAAFVLALFLLIAYNYHKNPCYDICKNPMLSFVSYHKYCVEGSPSFNQDFYTAYHERLDKCRNEVK